MTDWGDLHLELDRWGEAGRVARFWWRDDDAKEPTPELERLLMISKDFETPLALAIIPSGLREALADRIADTSDVSVLQHGYAHMNHAGPREKKAELGPHRPFDLTIAEIATGWQRLEKVMSARDLQHRLLPVMVPPWNRIAPKLAAMLPEMKFTGLSTFGARATPEAAPALRTINTHVDIMDWAGSRGFVGLSNALDAALRHLSARRLGQSDAEEPTGLLTHHLAHDPAAWQFISEFLNRTMSHPAACWVAADELFERHAS